MNPYKMTPLDDIVVVKMLKEDNVTKGGVIIPDNVMQQGVQAQVVAVSADVEDMEGLHAYTNVMLHWNLDHERTYNWDYEGDEYWVLPLELIECVVIHEGVLPDGLAIK